MKKLLITMAVAAASVAAYGQGVIAFANNTDNLIYFTTSASGMLGTDASATFINPYSGNPNSVLGSSLAIDGSIPALAGSPNFTAYLYAGTSAGSLTLQTTTTLGDFLVNGNPGQIDSVNATFNGPGGSASLPGGTAAFFQLVVAANQSYALGSADPTLSGNWATRTFYGGNSPVFSATPTAAIPFGMYVQAAPTLSTWAPSATFIPTDFADPEAGLSGFGGVAVYASAVPEPGTFALAGLGLAALLVLRRRNS